MKINLKSPHLKLFLISVIAVCLAFVALSFKEQQQKKFLILQEKLAQAQSLEDAEKILGDTDIKIQDSYKKIAVDLSNQRLLAFEGNDLKYYFIISSGTWGRTPTGLFTIWSKFRATKMSGGSREAGNYYYLPNVPYVMFFYNNQVAMSKGFSLHGTYWHDNFGHPMSHGCINMKTEDAQKIYDWSGPTLKEGQSSIRANKDNPGTKILIYGTAPSN